MFGFSRSRKHCGLQILDRQIKLVAAAGSSYNRIARYQRISLDEGVIREGQILDEEQLVRQLSGAVKTLSLQDHRVTMSVPTNSVILRRAVFPMVKDKELRNLIDVELHGGTTQLPFKKPVFDYITVKQTGDQQEVLIFASPMEVVQQYARIAKQAGLDPVAADSSPLALYRLLLRGMKNTGITLSNCFMFLDADHDRAELSIFVEGYPVFFRTVQISGHELFAEGDDRMNAYVNQLSVEMSRVMKYYQYTVAADPEGVKELVLVGEAKLTENLQKNFEPEFKRIYQLPMDGAITGFETDHKSFAVPIGLAMKGA
jgi:type IV pilus assembly protein PilM